MQKTVIFYLSAFILIIYLVSCRFNSPIQGSGADFLQGKWVQDSVAMQNQLVNYSLYEFNFSCDSFFVQIKSFSKVNAAIDTCMQKGEWTEFAKGAYQLKNDTLYLKGFFANADFTIKSEGCLRTGVFKNAFFLNNKSDSVLHITSLSETIPLTLRLKEKLFCTPKFL